MNKILLTSALCIATLFVSACNDSSGGSGTGGSSGGGTGGGAGTSDTDSSPLNARTQAVRHGAIVQFENITGATHYIVYTSTSNISSSSPSAGGSADFTCQQSPCLMTGIENGRRLNLRVEAVSGSNQLEISSQLAVVAGAINDTGEDSCISITTGSFPNGISSCDALPTGAAIWPNKVAGGIDLPSGRVAQQDGNTGRDANAQLVKIGSGKAGFDYTKLDSSGNSVSASSTAFECVRDNVTGLVWQTNRPTAQEWQGVQRDYGTAESHSEHYSRCGLTSGWRLPTKAEAESLLQYSRTGVSADTDFFTDLDNGWYWTSSAYPAALSGPDDDDGVQNDSVGSDFHNWVINFTTGQRSTFDTSGTGATSQSLTMYVNDTANP